MKGNMKIAGGILFVCLFTSSVAFAQDAAVKDSKSMLDEASAGVTRVESVMSDGQSMLAQAKEESDVSRMDCLNTQLINAKGYYNVIQNSEANLRDAVARNDTAAQQHHYKLVQLAVSKIDGIAARMSECANGVPGTLSGESIQDTQRTCKVEPCLGGEEYYEPSVKSEVQYMEKSAVDASPYL